DLLGAGTALIDPRLSSPIDVHVRPNNDVYFADFSNYRVRLMNAATGLLSTAAGNGSGTSAIGNSATKSTLLPTSVRSDGAGKLYITDVNGSVVVQVTPSNNISIVAGTLNAGGNQGGVPGTGRLNGPYQVALGSDGSIYIADYYNRLVRKVTATVPG